MAGHFDHTSNHLFDLDYKQYIFYSDELVYLLKVYAIGL